MRELHDTLFSIMAGKRSKIWATFLLSLFFILVGMGQMMVCKAAVPSCNMGCHGDSVTMVPTTSTIETPVTEPCCTMSEAPTADLTTIQQTQSAHPQLVLFVAQVLSHLSATNTASAPYLYYHPSVDYQPPIFILNRTLLI